MRFSRCGRLYRYTRLTDINLSTGRDFDLSSLWRLHACDVFFVILTLVTTIDMVSNMLIPYRPYLNKNNYIVNYIYCSREIKLLIS